MEDEDLTLKLNIAKNTNEEQSKKESFEFAWDEGHWNALGKAGKGNSCKYSLLYGFRVFIFQMFG